MYDFNYSNIVTSIPCVFANSKQDIYIFVGYLSCRTLKSLENVIKN